MKKRLLLLVSLALTAMMLVSCSNSNSPVATTQTPGVIAGDVLYKGIEVSRILDERLENTLGAPLKSRGPYYFYDGLEIYFNEHVDVISGTNLSLFAVNGVTLDKNQAELIAAFGNPIEYYKYRDYEYRASDYAGPPSNDNRMMRYHISCYILDYMLDFWFEQPDGKAYSINIKRFGQ